MVKLRRAVDGSFFVVVRRGIVESQGWKPGNELTLISVSRSPGLQPGDLILRKVGFNP
jgi:hypothetical protein